MVERRLAAEFVRRPSPRPLNEPSDEDVGWAREAYQQHIPSRVSYRTCLAEGCTDWPCRPYRRAAVILQHVGEIDSASRH